MSIRNCPRPETGAKRVKVEPSRHVSEMVGQSVGVVGLYFRAV